MRERELEQVMPEFYHRLMYKRIANAPTLQALDDIQIELIDRFGLLPEQTKAKEVNKIFSNAKSRTGDMLCSVGIGLTIDAMNKYA